MPPVLYAVYVIVYLLNTLVNSMCY